MVLYDNPRNDDEKKRIIPEGLYLFPKEVRKSENTSSLYAKVKVFNDENNTFIPDGWISLASSNFIIYGNPK